MKVKHEAAMDNIFNPQTAESNQKLVMAEDDSSAKTIEFLRARLLAERATSKSARQQALEMSEKVKDLHIRLETEIEHRKEAEASMKKVFLTLKAKGIVVDKVVPTDLNGKPVGGASPSDRVIDAKELSGEVPSHVADIPSSPVQHGMGERDVSSTQKKGILECTAELYGNSSVVGGTEDTSSTGDASGANPVERKACVPLKDFVEHSCSMDQVHNDHDNYTPNGTPIFKDDIGIGPSIQQGLGITTRLKTLLQQIEEEVVNLPEEQPLRTKLQGMAGHLANMLDRGQGAGSESDHLESSKQPESINFSSEGITALETKNGTHMKLPVQSKHADMIHVNEARRLPVNGTHQMDEGVNIRERLVKRLFPNSKAQLQQRHLMSSISTLSTASIGNTSLQSNAFHEGKPSCDLTNGSNRDAYVGPCPFLDRGPLAPHVLQYDNPHLQITYPPSMVHWGPILRSNSHVGRESPHLIEVSSPKSFDAFSAGDKFGYRHGQHNEFWSPGRASSGFEGQSAWFPARVDRQSRAMLPNGYKVSDISSEVLMDQDRRYNQQNMDLQGPFSERTLHSHQERDLRNSMIRATARQQLKDCPYNDEATSMDDKTGRLGGIPMAVDAARQHMQGEELTGPSTPMAVDVRLKRGYVHGDCIEQLSSELQRDTWWSRSHVPIVQFPPSPTSEHGYSPFERPRGVHRRSSSVSTNFMMSEWDHLQPRGEVHLGNGITLYTD